MINEALAEEVRRGEQRKKTSHRATAAVPRIRISSTKTERKSNRTRSESE